MPLGMGIEERAVSSVRPAYRRWSEWLSVSLLLVIVAVSSLGQAATKLFTYDELVTLRIASMPTLRDIWQFFIEGKDTTGLLPAFIVHFAQHLPWRLEVSTRLPFMLAYLLTCLCVYWFIRRAYSAGFAIAGAAVLPVGVATFFYATEIRAYAFLLLGSAVGAVCWRRANDSTRGSGLAALGLFAGLSMAILFHFFAIFLFAPFALAQWMQERATGVRRWGVWAALTLYPASVLLLAPTILAAHRIYGGTFWARPTWFGAIYPYLKYGFGFVTYAPFFVLMLALYLWLRLRGRLPKSLAATEASARGYSLPEWALLSGLAFLPWIALLGSLFLGAYRWSYVLPLFAGLAMLTAGLLAEVTRRSTWMGRIFALSLVILLTIQKEERLVGGVHMLSGRHSTALADPAQHTEGWYGSVKSIPLPLVAEGPITLLPLEQFGPAELRSRLVLLTSGSRASHYPVSMTYELNMESFGTTLHYNVQDYDAFTRTHPDFYILANTEWSEYTWLLRSLRDESEAKHDMQITMIWEPRSKNQLPGIVDRVFLVHLGQPAPVSAMQPSAAAGK